jgi:hypothetical protein
MKFSSAVSALVVASLAGVDASFERIAGYEPKSQVTDHNALDLDQEVCILAGRRSFVCNPPIFN